MRLLLILTVLTGSLIYGIGTFIDSVAADVAAQVATAQAASQ